MLNALKKLFTPSSKPVSVAPSDRAAILHEEGAAKFALGEVEAAIQKFRSAIEIDADYRLAYRDLCLALVKKGEADKARKVILKGLEIAPLFADFHYYLGNLHSLKNETDKAIACYRKALLLKPDYVEVLFNLGVALRKAGQLAEAEASYRKALAIAPEDPAVLTNLGQILDDQKRFSDAAVCYQKAFLLNPLHAAPNCNMGAVALREARLDEAEALFRKSLAINPDYVIVKYNLASLMLLTGSFSEGWLGYESRWFREEQSPRLFSQPLWLGDADITGKTILLYAEQGLGDTLQFARYAAEVAALGARVILEVQAPLKELLTGIPGAHSIFMAGETLPRFDYQCPLMSLPLAFKTDLRSIPAIREHLKAPTERVAFWGQRLAEMGAPRIGLVWSGNPQHGNDHNRSLPLAALAPLWQPGTRQFVCLQKDIRDEDRDLLRTTPWIGDVSAELSSFVETAALIENLDLVITVDTSVAHLAGAMGKPVWILLPEVPDWRWMLDRTDSPWYPSARLFRRKTLDNWAPVIEEILAALATY